MKGLIFFAAISLSSGATAATATMDPASLFVKDTLTRGRQVLENKSNSARLSGLCSLIKQKAAYTSIGYSWLGNFANLAREKQAVQRFARLVPSIVVTKFAQAMGNDPSAPQSITVSPTAENRGHGYSAVAVTVVTSGGQSYQGKAIVGATNGGGFKIYDLEYMGFSAVNYLARDYQNSLSQDYNRDPNGSMPVTALINEIMSDSAFVRCP